MECIKRIQNPDGYEIGSVASVTWYASWEQGTLECLLTLVNLAILEPVRVDAV